MGTQNTEYNFYKAGKLIDHKLNLPRPDPVPGLHWVINGEEVYITRVKVTPGGLTGPTKVDCTVT